MVQELKVLPDPRGSLLNVHLRPRASRAGRGGIREGALELKVNAPPVDGEANAAARELLAELLGVSRARVSLHAGAKSRRKIFLVEGLAPAEIRARLAAPGKNA